MSDLVRNLKIKGIDKVIDVDVKITDPTLERGSWFCRYEIGWPEGAKTGEAWGADAIQAVQLTMQAIALRLYGSSYHAERSLYWQKPGKGYGFPLPKNLADEHIGDDKDTF
jgi:hypothetical protein